MANTTVTQFPDDNIDPRLKGREWIMQFIKAAWTNKYGLYPATLGYNSQVFVDKVKSYRRGRQNTDKFKISPLGAPLQGETWMATEFEPIAVMPKFIDMMSAQLLQREYDIQAFAIDPVSVAEEDKEYKKSKIKLILRDAVKGTALENSPAVQLKPNEPEDLEELEMASDYGYKSSLTVVMEEIISLVLNNNDINEKRKKIIESLMDEGLGGFDIWIDDIGMVRFDTNETYGLVTSFCKKNDFSDASYIGSYKQVMVCDLLPYFEPNDINNICKAQVSKNGNPDVYYGYGLSNANYKQFKVNVLTMQFYSWDSYAYKKEKNSKQNDDIVKVDFKYTADKYTKSEDGKDPVFIKDVDKNIYKGSWIVDTNYIYDYGVSTDQMRKGSSYYLNAKMDSLLYAWNMYNMQIAGFTERLIPFADRYQKVWQKIQNIDAKLIPYVMNINYSALESVAFGSAGQKWTPQQTMDFILQNFTAVFRTDNLLEKERPGFQPVTFQSSPQLAIIAEYTNQLQSIIGQMYEISGLNQAVAGNPDSKLLTTGLLMQQKATNNALYVISQAENALYLALCDAIVCKAQMAIKAGKTEPYLRALGREAVNLLQLNTEGITAAEYGIKLYDAPTQEQRAELSQEINAKESMGLLNISDRSIIRESRNIKLAYRILGNRVKKREEEIRQQKLQAIQMQTQGNAQAGIAIEQAKQQTIMLQGKFDLQIENVKGQWNYITEQYKKGSDQTEAHIQANAKVISSQIAATAKKETQSLIGG